MKISKEFEHSKIYFYFSKKIRAKLVMYVSKWTIQKDTAQAVQDHVRVRHRIRGKDAIVQKENALLQAIRQYAVRDLQTMTMMKMTILYVDRVANVIENQHLSRVVVPVEVIVEVGEVEADRDVRVLVVEAVVVVVISVLLVRGVRDLVRSQENEQVNQNRHIFRLHRSQKPMRTQRMTTIL